MAYLILFAACLFESNVWSVLISKRFSTLSCTGPVFLLRPLLVERISVK